MKLKVSEGEKEWISECSGAIFPNFEKMALHVLEMVGLENSVFTLPSDLYLFSNLAVHSSILRAVREKEMFLLQASNRIFKVVYTSGEF